MARSPLFAKMLRSMRTAMLAERRGLSTADAVARVAEAEHHAFTAARSRREFMAMGGKAAAVGAALAVGAGCMADGPGEDAFGRTSQAARRPSAPDVGIVGAGFGGLLCAHELSINGIAATTHDANDRVGGRCFSAGGSFASPVSMPGQVFERGGELIDTGHKTLIDLARELGLTMENIVKQPGDVFYYFDGQHYPEEVVVEQFRELVPRMRDDYRASSGAPTAETHTDVDVTLDRTNLADYLVTRRAGPIAYQAIEQAYIAEYGAEISQQSCLAFLYFIHIDRRSKFTPFGVFSDERYHVIEGNQAIAEGVRARLPGPMQLGRKLVRARKTSAGRVELTFSEGRRTVTATHDAVVFAIPFSTLREVELDPSLGLPDWKQRAIRELVYGTNAKMMVGFRGPHWRALGSNGASYSDLPNCQTTWETNPSRATSEHAILTDYSGGIRGASLRPDRVQDEAARFLTDLERVFPGSLAGARRDGSRYVAHLEHWPSNPLTKGSYTNNHPGYFTTIADLEATPVGNVYFAGEHASSFYEWQGFMEGAALSGLHAAAAILRDYR